MKIMIMGYKGHGKDTVCEMLERHGYSFASSSEFMCENVVYPALKEKYNYESPEQCHADRDAHREEWYQLIADFNTPDKTALAQAIYADHDIYCGIRHIEEFSAIKAAKIFDYAVWVDASDRLPAEDESSCTVTSEMADFVIDNNGDLSALKNEVIKIARRLEHLEAKEQFDAKMNYYPAMTSGPGFTIFWHDQFTFPEDAQHAQNGALPEDVIDCVIHRLQAEQSTRLATPAHNDAIDYLRAGSSTLKSAPLADNVEAA
jgi:dephospho-CoA kinase